MKRLTKAQLKQHAELTGELFRAKAILDGAVATFNEKVAAAYAELQRPVDAFNTVASIANAFVTDIHSEQESYYGDKSERWQEGDAGSAYSEWMSGWELEIENVELEEPGELEAPDIDIEPFYQLETECTS